MVAPYSIDNFLLVGSFFVSPLHSAQNQYPLTFHHHSRLSHPDLDTILQNTFQLPSFREGQRAVVENVVNGSNTLVFMPTGGGKSLTYQLPGIAREGLAIIISPLISLMKDQLDKLRELGIRSELINSTISSEEQQMILREIMSGDPTPEMKEL